MKISIWQQFSSNHSAVCKMVGKVVSFTTSQILMNRRGRACSDRLRGFKFSAVYNSRNIHHESLHLATIQQ